MKQIKGKSAFLARCRAAREKKANPTGTHETPEKKPLFLVMQRYYFDQILTGEKTIEFRANKPFYAARLMKAGKYRKYKTVILQEGYHTGARKIMVTIKKIELCSDFEIHLGPILSRNF